MLDRELAVVGLGFGVDAVPYAAAWDIQRDLHARRASGDIPDTCLLLEHQPVYTAGRRTSQADRPIGDPGAPVLDVDRGGKITWHGPGQLVGYPIVALDQPVDVVGYVRAIEEALIRTCADVGLETARVPGRSGVWVRGTSGSQGRKVAAVGIRVARGVTMHGFALNCDNDLGWFDRIVPCGISDASVTTLSAERGLRITVTNVVDPVMNNLAGVLGASRVTRCSLPDVMATTVS
jgi:lipoyl(octanoyl) transferase